MKEKLFNRDCAGVAVSSLCLVHCVALPLAPVLFPALLPFVSEYFFKVNLLEYLFWGLAFVTTSLSLKKLLHPHSCKPHHPESKDALTSPHNNSSHNNTLYNCIATYKKWALGLSVVAWGWFLVVVLNHQPHLWTLATSVFLMASHVCALVFSIKTAKINQQTPITLAPSAPSV